MRTVYRYDLQEIDQQVIAMPKGAQLLLIERQTRLPLAMSLWALVDPDEEIVNRKIFWRGTGTTVPGDVTYHIPYINSYQEQNGFVWHFFDGGEQ